MSRKDFPAYCNSPQSYKKQKRCAKDIIKVLKYINLIILLFYDSHTFGISNGNAIANRIPEAAL